MPTRAEELRVEADNCEREARKATSATAMLKAWKAEQDGAAVNKS
jgi:hypothetical protein